MQACLRLQPLRRRFSLVKMATSKQTYECYVCKKNGFADVRVFLDGKTEDGKTIYKNEDLSAHQHKQQVKQQSQQQQPQQQASTTTIAIQPMSWKIIDAKLDRIIALLTESQQQSGK
jgi:hypothetical protein